MLAGHVPSDCNLNMLGEHRGTSLKIMVNKYFAWQDIPVKYFQPTKISGNCETEIDHNAQYSQYFHTCLRYFTSRR